MAVSFFESLNITVNHNELQNKWNWSANYQNIPEKFTEEFENISHEGDVIAFLYKHLTHDAKHVAEKLIKNYYGWNIDDIL